MDRGRGYGCPTGRFSAKHPYQPPFCERLEAYQSIPWKAGLKPHPQLNLDRFPLSNDRSFNTKILEFSRVEIFGSTCDRDPSRYLLYSRVIPRIDTEHPRQDDGKMTAR